MWVKHGSKYYGGSLYTMTRANAITYCGDHGGQLAQITNSIGFMHVLTAVGERTFALLGWPSIVIT